MDDLIAFLNARLDEDETAAKAATEGPWEWVTPEHVEWSDHGPHLMSKTATWIAPGGGGPYPAKVLGSWGYDAWGVDIEDGDAAHIALHDPARVLREVEAGRVLLKYLTDMSGQPVMLLVGESAEAVGQGDGIVLRASWLLREFAAVYSDHPDYRQEWKP